MGLQIQSWDFIVKLAILQITLCIDNKISKIEKMYLFIECAVLKYELMFLYHEVNYIAV